MNVLKYVLLQQSIMKSDSPDVVKVAEIMILVRENVDKAAEDALEKFS